MADFFVVVVVWISTVALHHLTTERKLAHYTSFLAFSYYLSTQRSLYRLISTDRVQNFNVALNLKPKLPATINRR